MNTTSTTHAARTSHAPRGTAASKGAVTAQSRHRNTVRAHLAPLAAFAGLIAAAALALAPATAASAHDELVSSTPAANATVATATPRVTLTFDDTVLDENGHGALVQVTDASGRNFETACASAQGRNVTVPVALGAPGPYRVTWQVVSSDGHPVSDSLQFNYTGPKAGAGHAGPLAKCGGTMQAPAAQGSSVKGGGSERSTAAAVVFVVVAAGVVALALVLVVIALVGSRRKRKRATH